MSMARLKRRTFLPYPFEPLALRLHVGIEHGVRDIDEANLAVTLDELEHWEELTLSLRVHVVSVAASQALEAGRCSLWVNARCRATRWRVAVRLEPHSTEDWRGKLVVRRADLRDELLLDPTLLADGPQQGALASERLAAGRPWIVRVDTRKVQSDSHLEVRFRSFADSADISAPADALYWLDADSEQPLLWLNEDHARAGSALRSEGSRGALARIRDVAFDAIASAVWCQLFVHAVEGHHDGEAVYGWHAAVVQRIGEQLFPQVASAQVAREVLREVEFAGMARMLGRVDLALQSRNGLASHLEKLVEEVL